MISYKNVVRDLKKGVAKYESSAHYTWESLRKTLSLLGADRGAGGTIGGGNLKILKKKNYEEDDDNSKYANCGDVAFKTNIINRLYYCQDKNFLRIFQDCKKQLIYIGVNFGKKSGDDKYISALNYLFEVYMINQSKIDDENDFQKYAQEALEGFSVTIDQDTYNKFSLQFDEIGKMYKSLIRVPYNSSKETGFAEEWNYGNNMGELITVPTYIKDEIAETYQNAAENLFLKEFEELEDISDEDWEDNDQDKEQKAQLVKKNAQVATLGTIEAAKAFDEAYKNENFTRLKRKDEVDADENMFKTFYKEYGTALSCNEYWQVNQFSCIEYLANYNKTNDEIFDHLLNLLEGNFDACQFLQENRDSVVKEWKKTRKEFENKISSNQRSANYGAIAQTLSIGKKNQKMEKKYGTEEKGLTNHEILAMIGLDEDEIKMEGKLGLKKKNVGSKNLMYDSDEEGEEETLIDFVNLTSNRLSEELGPRYEKKDTENFLIYNCQPIPKLESVPENELVQIREFPEFLHQVFNNIERQNPLQSKVKELAFETDENLLVCAPTGAGKTNVALMTILRECNKAYDELIEKCGEFKIVYISPLKALAAEITEKFSARLSYLGVNVKEFTGDVSQSKTDLAETHVIIATPEKWDVMTRKSDAISDLVKCIIIDEIHLLDEERGRVLECIVARTLLAIERKQQHIRLVGLSATQPNYLDVAKFLQVRKGLFFFDEAYRPVPLYKKFIGVRKPQMKKRDLSEEKRFADAKHKGKDKIPRKPREKVKDIRGLMDEMAFDIVQNNLYSNQQILVFVHSRRDTIKTAEAFIEFAKERNLAMKYWYYRGEVKPVAHNLVNKDLKHLIEHGIGSHNAGLSRKDRKLIENNFLEGKLRVVVCTATLAWGVNLPAHAVVIKGTDIYEGGHGWKDLSILDVNQIFGRAGRPQYDTYGEATLITKIERLNHYMGSMNSVKPIESNFATCLKEAINAEIALGNITNTQEAFQYMRRTFFYVRACKSPMSCRLKSRKDVEPFVFGMIERCQHDLHLLRLIRLDEKNNFVESTELGRIASHFYINCSTMQRFCTYQNFYDETADNIEYKAYNNVNVNFAGDIDDQNLVAILAQASEFEQLQTRQEEKGELVELKDVTFLKKADGHFLNLVKGDDEASGSGDNLTMDCVEKVQLLIQGFLSMQSYDQYSLVADTFYIIQNGSRILRCIFEICLRKNQSDLSITVLKWCRYIENCVRDDCTPLRMFCFDNAIKGLFSQKRGSDLKRNNNFQDNMTCSKIEDIMWEDVNGKNMVSVQSLRENKDVQQMLRLPSSESFALKRVIFNYPLLDVEYSIRPIAQTILKLTINISPNFIYSKQFHMPKETFWVIIEDNGEILHYESIGIVTKNLMTLKNKNKGAGDESNLEVSFFIPFREGRQYYNLNIISDRFVDADTNMEIDQTEIETHTERMEYTNLLNLRPLPVSVLNNEKFEQLYSHIKFFNPIQTQIFHALFYTNNNALIGAPTGSGKTIMAELGILRVFEHNEKGKIIYIAPYKALAKERLKDWHKRMGLGPLKKKVLELTGDYTPDLDALVQSDVLITTPEKWDGISRNWQHRSYVRHVDLIIFDEIHLLGQERGAVQEVIVSRMNYIATQLDKTVRMIGLSTAMANGADVANWFGVKKNFMFNFRPNVRPVPIEIHFKGFSDKNYCPRMNSMNKPAYNDIKKFSDGAPVLIFVSSRRQTRLTALDLISQAANEYQARSPFMRLTDEELSDTLGKIQDTYLKQTMAFGVGMHHAGLVASDRGIVEDLFVQGSIQIMVATSTLAWGVNFPAKLVIIKGTEFFDPKQKGYVDMPITDILQMVGRAGRPQFNDTGFACVYVEKSKKNFYRKYLNDPFPIESALKEQLSEHINAEISSGTITNKQNCMEFLTWTYYFRRITRNPLYYDIDKTDHHSIQQYLIELIDNTIVELEDSNCVTCEDDFRLNPTFNGQMAALYYIKHKSVKNLDQRLKSGQSIYELIKILTDCEEFDEVPVRHNEDGLNEALANICPYKVNRAKLGDPKIKTLQLFQAYFSSQPLPIRDYITDTKLVLDNCIRFQQAMIDIAAEKGYLDTCLNICQLSQMVTQGVWINKSALVNIPYFSDELIEKLQKEENVQHLCQILKIHKSGLLKNFQREMGYKFEDYQWKEINDCLKKIPDISFTCKLWKFDDVEMKPILKEGMSLRDCEEAQLVVHIRRENSDYPLRVEMKKMGKIKDAAWWIIFGNEKLNEIYSVKRTFFKTKITRDFQFVLPQKDKNLTVYLMSDSYIGIDQVYKFDLNTYQTRRPPAFDGNFQNGKKPANQK